MLGRTALDQTMLSGASSWTRQAEPATGLFVYGTLMFPEMLSALLGRVPARTAASANGWRVSALPGRVYPGLVRDGYSTAAGQVIAGLSKAEGQLIDAYENGEYRLSEITLGDGRNYLTYVWRTKALYEDWNLDRFAATHLTDHVAKCARWRVDGRWGPLN
jgi:hypothetical protein